MILNYSVSSLVRRLTNSVHLLILKSNPPFLQMLEGGSKMSYYFFSVSLVVFILKLSKCIFRRAILDVI